MNAFTPRTEFLLHSLPPMSEDELADLCLVLADQAGLDCGDQNKLEHMLDDMLAERDDARERAARTAKRERHELECEQGYEALADAYADGER